MCAPDEVPQELLAVKSLLRYNTPVNIPCKGHKYAGNKVSSAIAGQTSPPKARGGYQRRAPPPPHPYGSYGRARGDRTDDPGQDLTGRPFGVHGCLCARLVCLGPDPPP